MLSCLCVCSFCGNGFSRSIPSILNLYLPGAAGVAGVAGSYLRPSGVYCCRSAGGYCFFHNSPSNWIGKRLASLFLKLERWKVLDIYLHSPGTGREPLALSARHLVPHPRKAGKANLVDCISPAAALTDSSLIPHHPSLD